MYLNLRGKLSLFLVRMIGRVGVVRGLVVRCRSDRSISRQHRCRFGRHILGGPTFRTDDIVPPCFVVLSVVKTDRHTYFPVRISLSLCWFSGALSLLCFLSCRRLWRYLGHDTTRVSPAQVLRCIVATLNNAAFLRGE